MQKTINIHKDHRKRVREKFEKVGLTGFADHEILEFVLFYSIPYKDTNPIAHRLIAKFGDLQSVFAASKDELIEVEGVSDNTATLIKLVPALIKELSTRTAKQTKILNGYTDSCKFATELLREEEKEMVYIICLDRKNHVKATKQISSGGETYAVVDTKELTKYILQKSVDRIILAHNHPIGSAMPSDQDIMFTQRIMEALSPLGIEVLDHIVVSKTESFSFAHKGIIAQIKKQAKLAKYSIHQIADKKPVFDDQN